jgi:ATPase subunit of ABC transporter with duplicated ATPase domains
VETEPDAGSVKWGVSTTQAYFAKEHNHFFDGIDLSLIDWMRPFSEDKRESYCDLPRRMPSRRRGLQTRQGAFRR